MSSSIDDDDDDDDELLVQDRILLMVMARSEHNLTRRCASPLLFVLVNLLLWLIELF